MNEFIRRLGSSLNYATAASLGRNNAFDPKLNQFVAYIAFCKGIPFYGFHVGYRYFLKIYCCQPRFKKRMAALLRTGHVMPKKVTKGRLDEGRNPGGGFKIFEEHVPFHLQFMLDHNLYGCGFIDLRTCKFRQPLPGESCLLHPELPLKAHPTADTAPSALQSSNGSSNASEREKPAFTNATVPDEKIAHAHLEKLSHCVLEADCHVSDILNRYRISERRLHQDFTEFLYSPIPEDEKLVNSVKELWEDERRRRRDRGEKGPEEVRESGSGSQRDYKRGEQPTWATETKLREDIARLADRDRRRRTEKYGLNAFNNLNFEAYVRPEAQLQHRWVRTTFEAVDAIFPQTWARDERLGQENPYGVWAVNGIGVDTRPRINGSGDDVVDAAGLDFQDNDDDEGAMDHGGQDAYEDFVGGEADHDEDSDHGDMPAVAPQLPAAGLSPPASDQRDQDERIPPEDLLENPATQRGATYLAWQAPETLFRESSSDDETDPGTPRSQRRASGTAKPRIVRSVTTADPVPSPAPSNDMPSEQVTPSKASRQPTASPVKRPSHGINLFTSPSKQIKVAPQAFAAPRHEGERRMALRNEGLQVVGSQDRKRPIDEQVAAFNQPRGGKLPRMFGVESVANVSRRARPAEHDSSLSSAESLLLAPTQVLPTSDRSSSSQESMRPPTPPALQPISEDDAGQLVPTMIVPSSQDELVSSSDANAIAPSNHRVSPPQNTSGQSCQSDVASKQDLERNVVLSSSSQPTPTRLLRSSQAASSLKSTSSEPNSNSARNPADPRPTVTSLFRFRKEAPRTASLLASIAVHKVYQAPYFSNSADVPPRPREYAGRMFKIGGLGLRFMSDFEHKGAKEVGRHPLVRSSAVNIRTWEFSRPPPSPKVLKLVTGKCSVCPYWQATLTKKESRRSRRRYRESIDAQVTGP